jgi:hypothetical protein
MKIKDPKIIKNIFSDEDFLKIKDFFIKKQKNKENFERSFGRYTYSDDIVKEYLDKLVILAREVFDSKTLVPSYALFAHYEGEHASLFSHVDDNACTYTLDMCLYQNEPWELYVNEVPYILNENEALAYYGNDQYHERLPIPNPNSQYVAMIFFHFVEPDHWWCTKGPGYLDVIRNHITEEEWEKRNNIKL